MKIDNTSLDIYDGCHMLVIEDVFVFFECELPNEKISKNDRQVHKLGRNFKP